jgi:hypothetical protein
MKRISERERRRRALQSMRSRQIKFGDSSSGPVAFMPTKVRGHRGYSMVELPDVTNAKTAIRGPRGYLMLDEVADVPPETWKAMEKLTERKPDPQLDSGERKPIT